MHKKHSKRIFNIFKLISLIALYFILQASVIILSSKNVTMFNGVICAFQYAVCLVLIYSCKKEGSIVSIVLMSISIVLLSNDLFIRGQRSSLPGLFNSIFYIITIIILTIHYKSRVTESITDIITGVLNRRGLYIKIQNLIDNNKQFSLIYISMDNYKLMNDTYGHAYGDELLRKISKRITSYLGKNTLIARITGAEFVIIINNKSDAKKIANELLELLREKSVLVVNDNRIDCYMTCYAGVTTYPETTGDYEALIKYADIAMYEAMSNKSKNAYVFDINMARNMNRQLEVEKLIKEGLNKHYYYLVYQPQYNIKEKKLRGFETLIRMNPGNGESVGPTEFIPVAEKSNLILQIDDYVLQQAMSEFKDVVTESPDIVISINVSAKNICEESFIDKIKAYLGRTGFPAKNLEIEITEYCMINSMETTIENIKALRELGIKIALDDFGTGYTSLHYLSSLPINLLKIDKSLIDEIDTDTKQREFVQAVIAMSKIMGCESISEGVEKDSQLECLIEDGCDFVQGYIWGRPLYYNDAIALVKKNQSI